MAGSNVMALDVGEARIGVAVANVVARLPRPLTTLSNTTASMAELEKLCKSEEIGTVVIGLPRGLSGQETNQTARARTFADMVQRSLKLPVVMQDEAVTSIHAEQELRSRGKPYRKEDIDALAATYILEDYLREHV